MTEKKWLEGDGSASKAIAVGRVYPKPSISVSPNHVVAEGENVSIHCRIEDRNEDRKNSQMEFSLVDKGKHATCARKKTETPGVTFSILNVNTANGGIYYCEYRPPEANQWSDVSDEIYINVTDPRLEKPSIILQGEPAVGKNVTVECQGPEQDLVFSLHNSRSLTAVRMVEADGNTAYFPFQMLRLEDAGTYTCRYHSKEKPFLWSGPSKPVDLILQDQTIIWAICGAAGLLLLVLLLLLLAFLFHRRRKRGSAAEKRTQPLSGEATNTIPEAGAGDPNGAGDPDGVSYAVLNHQPWKTTQGANPDTVPESCVYASVAKDRPRKGQ
ncbi:hypothetical protein lerEdw1_006984 [Lerista edwardsae]|nr:hypothetical protein lerEdw1_006984 [Lerista edwardsae]